jgi:hypothetical protein
MREALPLLTGAENFRAVKHIGLVQAVCVAKRFTARESSPG